MPVRLERLEGLGHLPFRHRILVAVEKHRVQILRHVVALAHDGVVDALVIAQDLPAVPAVEPIERVPGQKVPVLLVQRLVRGRRAGERVVSGGDAVETIFVLCNHRWVVAPFALLGFLNLRGMVPRQEQQTHRRAPHLRRETKHRHLAGVFARRGGVVDGHVIVHVLLGVRCGDTLGAPVLVGLLVVASQVWGVVMVASHVWGRDVERCGGIAARANVRHPGEGGEGEERREDSGMAPLKVLGWILVVPPRVRAKRGFLVLEDGGQRARGRPVGRRYAVRAHSVMRGSRHVSCAASPTHRVASPTDRYHVHMSSEIFWRMVLAWR